MEKLVMPLWRPEGTTGDEFRDTLLALAAEQLCQLPAVRALRLAVVDSDVSPADNKRMASFGELPDGVLSAWVDSVTHADSLQRLLEPVVAKSAAYLVTESEQLVNSESVDARGRLPGFCQVVFLQRPDRLSEQAWLDIWQGSHTGIAIGNVVGSNTANTVCFHFSRYKKSSLMGEKLSTNRAVFVSNFMVCNLPVGTTNISPAFRCSSGSPSQ